MAAGERPENGAAEPNPFSFREFVRSKARGDGGAPALRAEERGPRPASPPQAARPAPHLGALLPLPGLAPPGGAEDDEEERSGSYRPAAAERAHRAVSGAGASTAARGRGYEELKAENAALRSRVGELRELAEAQAEMMRKLERKLEENKLKEEKEAQDLEAMVQHVEQNLQLMTKRALKAESNVAKLKQENALLQVRLKNCEMENEALRSGQCASLAAVKQNAATAVQNLLAVIASSRSSIKQLISGAESLQLVADLLRSIDRISEAAEDGP
ncbi:hypothetical protein ASZ78_005688 [Callipepla squamata]|uniref:Endosome-associated-trafficking regulator 1 n=1 Tax=Callipepla squamata TaxID=9009 RepID=A0A226NHF8_CALSU|nr:hypothetical protein ASZ78_005688 [Callipepla squamata]